MKYKYVAKVIGQIENEPGTWHSSKVGVFRVENDVEEQVGEYTRNYPQLFNTFFHFQLNGEDYALYSPDYTVTRILKLPSCKDIGGEDPVSHGFCPVDFYVPSYIDRELVGLDDSVSRYRINRPKPEDLLPRTTTYTPLDPKTGERIKVEKPSYPVSPLTFYLFGFVAGCIWGDDGSWKIQYLDLSQASKGVIKRDERFGYISLPTNMNLETAIDLSGYMYDPKEDYSHTIQIAIQQRFDLRTGEALSDAF